MPERLSCCRINEPRYIDNKLVANGTIYCMRENMKTRHRAGYGIAVLKDYWDLGIGHMLTKCCLDYAKKLGYEQVELQVVADKKSSPCL